MLYMTLLRQARWSRHRCFHRKFHCQRTLYSLNEFGVDLLPAQLNHILFNRVRCEPPSKDKTDSALAELEKFSLNSGGVKVNIPEISSWLPPLQGKNVLEHFNRVCREQNKPYLTVLKALLSTEAPPPPVSWQLAPGWVRYGFDGTVTQVNTPSGQYCRIL